MRGVPFLPLLSHRKGDEPDKSLHPSWSPTKQATTGVSAHLGFGQNAQGVLAHKAHLWARKESQNQQSSIRDKRKPKRKYNEINIESHPNQDGVENTYPQRYNSRLQPS